MTRDPLPSAHRVIQHRSALAGVEAVTLTTDRAFPRHAHDTYGVGLVAEGGQRSWSGIGPVEAGAGDVITVNPGEMHDGLPIGGASRRWRMLYIAPEILSEAGGVTSDEIELALPVARDRPVAEAITAAFAAVTAAETLAAEEAVVQLRHVLLRRLAAKPHVEERARSAPVRRALQRLDDAPELPASLLDLAALCGLSRFQLIRGFAREVGITPHAYLLQRRVQTARRLLAAGMAPAEAAAASGFADQAHLTRAFVRQFGLTPGRYRTALR